MFQSRSISPRSITSRGLRPSNCVVQGVEPLGDCLRPYQLGEPLWKRSVSSVPVGNPGSSGLPPLSPRRDRPLRVAGQRQEKALRVRPSFRRTSCTGDAASARPGEWSAWRVLWSGPRLRRLPCLRCAHGFCSSLLIIGVRSEIIKLQLHAETHALIPRSAEEDQLG